MAASQKAWFLLRSKGMQRWLGICFVLFGCNGSVSTADTTTASGDGGQGTDSTIPSSTKGGQSGDGGAVTATGDDGAPHTDDAGEGGCLSPNAIVDDPPRQVTFAFTTSSAAPRFLVTNGENCHVFTVDDLDVTGYWPPCPLGDVDASTMINFSSIAPDASVTLSWDGCSIVFQQGVINCQGYPFEPFGATCVNTMFTVRKALGAGHHVARFAVAEGTPSCGSDAAGYPCTASYGPICNPDAGVPSTILDVPFDLPDAGPDAAPITVNVTVP